MTVANTFTTKYKKQVYRFTNEEGWTVSFSFLVDGKRITMEANAYTSDTNEALKILQSSTEAELRTLVGLELFYEERIRNHSCDPDGSANTLAINAIYDWYEDRGATLYDTHLAFRLSEKHRRAKDVERK